MSPAIVHASSGFLMQVGEAAARATVLACLVAAALATLRVKAVSLELRVWQGVLVAALAMPLLMLVTPQVRVPIPSFPTRAVRQSHHPAETASVGRIPFETLPVRASAPVDSSAVPEFAEAASRRNALAWPIVLMATYIAMAVLLLGRFLVGSRCANRLVEAARPIDDPVALHILSACLLASEAGRFLTIAESDLAAVPVTFGVRNPVILLPATWREWETQELAAVLMHEVSHVARRDPLVERLALIHRAIFWFSPLAWWLERHLADLAEQASDEAALAGGVDRVRYAETLLGFFATLEAAPQRVWWQGVAMAKAGQAEKRVDRILAWRGAMRKQCKKSLIVAVAVFGVAVVGFAASVHPWLLSFQQAPPPPAPPKPSADPVVNPGPPPQAPANLPAAPVAPEVPSAAPLAPGAILDQDVPPPPALPGSAELSRMRAEILAAKQLLRAARIQVAAAKAEISHPVTEEQLESVRKAMELYSKAMGDYQAAIQHYQLTVAEQEQTRPASTVPKADEDSTIRANGGSRTIPGNVTGQYWEDVSGPRFVIVTKNSDSLTMSGTEEDARHARALRSKIPGDFIWFERDEKSYIIRDQATVDKAKSFWAPEEELGKKQAELGKQQEALGEQQEKLGEKMQEVRVKIPDMSAQLQKLEAEMKQLSANGGTVEQIGDLQSEIGELQSRIGEFESEAGRQQGDIGRQQGELGRQQGELGREQGELGREQGELARQASRRMKQLLDDAMARGLAQPE
jgi:beta-lactamase regulating signal transducer with metallopeptidase domain